jgi:hypothetical protein
MGIEMSGIKDGGAAFPFQDVDPRGDPNSPNFGMSLRDYFAGQALAGILSGDHPICKEDYPEKTVAAASFAFADAMLKARETQS